MVKLEFSNQPENQVDQLSVLVYFVPQTPGKS